MQSITKITIHHCTMTIFFILIFKQFDYKFWLKFISSHYETSYMTHKKGTRRYFSFWFLTWDVECKTRDYFDQKSDVSRSIYKFLVCYIMCLMLRHNFLSSCYCDSGHFINITGQFSISKILFFHTKDLYVLLWLSRKFSLPFTLNTGLRGKV